MVLGLGVECQRLAVLWRLLGSGTQCCRDLLLGPGFRNKARLGYFLVTVGFGSDNPAAERTGNEVMSLNM